MKVIPGTSNLCFLAPDKEFQVIFGNLPPISSWVDLACFEVFVTTPGQGKHAKFINKRHGVGLENPAYISYT